MAQLKYFFQENHKHFPFRKTFIEPVFNIGTRSVKKYPKWWGLGKFKIWYKAAFFSEYVAKLWMMFYAQFSILAKQNENIYDLLLPKTTLIKKISV